MLNAQIAIELGCSRSKITKLLQYVSKKHGVPLEDGRVRRARLAKKCVQMLKHQEIADEVMRRYQNDELLDDIAIGLNVDRNLVTAAVRWWHEVRGLPAPDGRTRRKSLKHKSRKDQNRPPDPPTN
jgi:biotin operon repressor